LNSTLLASGSLLLGGATPMDLLAKDDCIDAWLGNDHKYGPAAVEAARNTTRSGHTIKPAFGIPNQTFIRDTHRRGHHRSGAGGLARRSPPARMQRAAHRNFRVGRDNPLLDRVNLAKSLGCGYFRTTGRTASENPNGSTL
jgi:hypothetical protein